MEKGPWTNSIKGQRNDRHSVSIVKNWMGRVKEKYKFASSRNILKDEGIFKLAPEMNGGARGKSESTM